MNLSYFTCTSATATTTAVIANNKCQDYIPVADQVPVGELTISGTSTDNATSDCTIYADWNNTKLFQKAVATGPGGVND
jgi:hypothetical protein